METATGNARPPRQTACDTADMHKLLLSVGGNLGDIPRRLDELWPQLEAKMGKVACVSPYYRSRPWGFQSAHDFVNAAALVLTRLEPLEALRIAQELEKAAGRHTKSADGHYQDRPLDIDLIAYDDLVLQHDRLSLPHPLLHRRRFVLQPICDICPEWVHPLLHRDAQSLLQACDDPGELTRIPLKTNP